jgi:hypothetical protein
LELEPSAAAHTPTDIACLGTAPDAWRITAM